MSPKPLQAAGFQWSSCLSPAVKRKRSSGLRPTARRWRLWVVLGWKKASEAGGQADHSGLFVSGTGWQGFDLLRDVPLSCRQSVPLFLSLSPVTDPQLTNLTHSHLLLIEIFFSFYGCNLQSGTKVPWQHAAMLLWRVSSQYRIPFH